MSTFSNSSDVINTSDIMNRMLELHSECNDFVERYWADNNLEESDGCVWCEHGPQDDVKELDVLHKMADEAITFGSGWAPGQKIIRDSYFLEYAQQRAVDIGAIDAIEQWPSEFIDWDKAVIELQKDYASVDFDGVTYWIRAHWSS